LDPVLLAVVVKSRRSRFTLESTANHGGGVFFYTIMPLVVKRPAKNIFPWWRRPISAKSRQSNHLTPPPIRDLLFPYEWVMVKFNGCGLFLGIENRGFGTAAGPVFNPHHSGP
jgi:hypothetical protein